MENYAIKIYIAEEIFRVNEKPRKQVGLGLTEETFLLVDEQQKARGTRENRSLEKFTKSDSHWGPSPDCRAGVVLLSTKKRIIIIIIKIIYIAQRRHI